MKYSSTLLAAAAALAFASNSMATPLTTGITPVVPSVSIPVPITLQASYTFNFSNALEQGTVHEDVYSETGGTLDFFYQVTDNASSTDYLDRLTLGNFAGYTTDVSYVPSASGDAPTTATRLTANSVGFNVLVSPGTSSDILEIATNATAFGPGSISVIDSFTSSTNQADGPEAAPEPSTWALLGLAGLTALLFRQRRLSA